MNSTFRPRLFAAAIACLTPACLALAPAVQAQTPNYPAKPIRFVVAFPPGGPTDLLARVVSQKVSESVGQPMVVENVAGATGTIAHAQVAKAPPDGYTLLMASTSSHIAPYLLKTMPYDPLKDLTGVINVATLGFMLVVNAGVPATNPQELVALARAKPNELNYYSPGSGSAGHLVNERFKRMAGIEVTHVPFKGAGPGMTALVGGQIQMVLETYSTAGPHVKSGKLRALAFAGSTRSPLMPDLPTMAEAGLKPFDAYIWFGVMAPGATPPAILAKMNAEITKAMLSPELQARLAAIGGEFKPQSVQGFNDYLRSDTEVWMKVIQETGARAD